MTNDPIFGLRADLDVWSAQLREWEEKLLSTQAELLRAHEAELADWRGQLEGAATRLRELRASSEAGAVRAREVEATLNEVAETFRRVRERLGPRKP